MNMVERVRESMKARFIKKIEESSGLSFGESGVSIPNDGLWDEYARASIAAMMEPTEGMDDAGFMAGSVQSSGGDWEFASPTQTWKAMITAALEE